MYTFRESTSKWVHNLKKEATRNPLFSHTWVWREKRNYFNSLSSIFDMVCSKTNPECKIKHWSLVIQPSDTPALNENHASEKTCAENLIIFSIPFNLHGEEERINVHNGRIFFYSLKKIFNGKVLGKKKKLWGFFPPEWKREGRRMRGISLLFYLCK